MNEKLVAKELMRVAKILVSESVPHLDGFSTVDELSAHYKKYGGEISQIQHKGGEGYFVVTLPKQNRRHFYELGHDHKRLGKYPWIFKSEGYWDEHTR